ncbi:MAG: hypothetical protein H6765_01775 [Candidatus Peribacteria bacterium]|nr:MAG: hypothetical protein H6765_01775 [Candidatus Peribacteria bacterium]
MVDKVDHMFVQIDKEHKYSFLGEILQNNKDFKVLIFSETKIGVEKLATDLRRDGYAADALHGDMEQRDRFSTLKRIKS